MYKILRAIVFLSDIGIRVDKQSIHNECGKGSKGILTRLEEEYLVTQHRGEYVLTEDGQATLDASAEHPYYVADTAFRNDVLWPTKHTCGIRDELDGNPALPTPGSHQYADPEWSTIKLADQYDLIRETIETVQERYHYGLERVMRYHDDNRLGLCDNCGKVGVFRGTAAGNHRNKCTICEGRCREHGT